MWIRWIRIRNTDFNKADHYAGFYVFFSLFYGQVDLSAEIATT
jgi:hypothetical protein